MKLKSNIAASIVKFLISADIHTHIIELSTLFQQNRKNKNYICIVCTCMYVYESISMLCEPYINYYHALPCSGK